MIYLDYAASTPMSDQALDVYSQTSRTFFGNSMSLHDVGSQTEALLTHCRGRVGARLNGDENGINFTSGGSESNWIAIYGLAVGNQKKGTHILVDSGAHDSVKSSLEWLGGQGFQVDEIPADSKGQIGIEQIQPLLKQDTVLVVLAHVNSEFGFIGDLPKISRFLHEQGVLLHVDAVQSFGKLPIDVKREPITSLSFSSHKIYGPKGVGGLYVDPTIHFEPFLPSVSHEFGRRQGTVNVPGIAAFAEAMENSFERMTATYNHVKSLKSYMLKRISDLDLPIVSESPLEETSPYILALRVLGLEGQWVMLEANRRGVAISTGSACSVHKQKPSSLLLNMGRTIEEARQVIRLSFGVPTTEEEVEQTVTIFKEIVENAKSKAINSNI